MKYVPPCGMILVNFTTRGYKSMEQENTKNEHIFGDGIQFIDLLSEIDDLPREAADALQRIVMTHGKYASYFDERRTKGIGILVDNGLLVDVTDPKRILEKKYSRDNLFMELSKRQYDIVPNTGTTKQQMIDWIVENSEELKIKLAFKYITLNYSEKTEQHITELLKLINEIDNRITYRAERVLLSDFYNMLEEEKQNKDITDDEINKMMEQWKEEPSKKKKQVALLLCIFGGYFGLHHFYVGKIGIGILYLCTVGLFGIGWIVDIIKVATGKFKDKYGHYLK